MTVDSNKTAETMIVAAIEILRDPCQDLVELTYKACLEYDLAEYVDL